MSIDHYGRSVAEQRSIMATLSSTYEARTRVSVISLDETHRIDVTRYFLDGQVDIDATADVTRSASLTFHDPNRALPFDADHPSDTALFLDRMIRVDYDVLVAGSWVALPVFTGPVTKLDRNGSQVTVECQGKETLLLGAAWRSMTLRRGLARTDAIGQLLTEGNPVYREGHRSIPDLASRLPKHLSLTRVSVPWVEARKIAHSLNRQLYYDGAGVARLRSWPNRVGFTFRSDLHVTSDPQITVDPSAGLVNAVAVLGVVPKGAKQHVKAVAVAPANHPLSPQRIGRYLLPSGDYVQDDSIKTTREAQDRADQLLADGLRQAVDVSFDSRVVPFLDPGDLCSVRTDELSVTFRLTKASIPLTASGAAMSVGYHRAVAFRVPRARHHHRGRHH